MMMLLASSDVKITFVNRQEGRKAPVLASWIPERMEVTGEIWAIGSRRNTDGYWRSYSDLMNVHPNFRYCPNAGLWNALSHGWKTSEG